MKSRIPLLVNLILIFGSVLFLVLSFSCKITNDKQALYQNLFAEFIGAFLTVNIIDRLLESKWNPIKSRLAFNIQDLLMNFTNEYLIFFGYNENTNKTQFDKIKTNDIENPYVKTLYDELLKFNFENKMIQLSNFQMMDLEVKISGQIVELEKIINLSVSKIDVEELNNLLSINYSLQSARRNLKTLLGTYIVSTTNQSQNQTVEISIYLGLIGINMQELFTSMIALEKVIEPKRRDIERENLNRALNLLKEYTRKKKG